MQTLNEYIETHERELVAKLAELDAERTAVERELSEVRRAKVAAGLSVSAPASERPSMVDGLTMKALVLKALAEQFPNGATTRQLLNFFRDAWGRQIERTNLSPQLTRLFRGQRIERIDGKWVRSR